MCLLRSLLVLSCPPSAATGLVSHRPRPLFVLSLLGMRCRRLHHWAMTHLPPGTSPGSLVPHLCAEGAHGYMKGEPSEGTRDQRRLPPPPHRPSLWGPCSPSAVLWRCPAPRNQPPPVSSPWPETQASSRGLEMVQGNGDPRPQDSTAEQEPDPEPQLLRHRSLAGRRGTGPWFVTAAVPGLPGDHRKHYICSHQGASSPRHA